MLRSNDGPADPLGGFWHSTIGETARRDAGGIWRWKGELQHLYHRLTIPNATCFDENRAVAYFADTTAARSGRNRWMGTAGRKATAVFLDLFPEGLKPDGALSDAEGRPWIALFGAGRVVCQAPDGHRVASVDVPAWQVTCPVFDGPDLTVLMVTTAWEDMGAAQRAADPQAGRCFVGQTTARGLAAPRARLHEGAGIPAPYDGARSRPAADTPTGSGPVRRLRPGERGEGQAMILGPRSDCR